MWEYMNTHIPQHLF